MNYRSPRLRRAAVDAAGRLASLAALIRDPGATPEAIEAASQAVIDATLEAAREVANESVASHIYSHVGQMHVPPKPPKKPKP